MVYPDYINSDGILVDTEAWVAIETDTSSGSTALFNFTSTADGHTGDFSQYVDLVLIMYVNGSSSGTYSKLNFNSDTSSNYSYQNLYTQGSNMYAGGGGSGSNLSYFDGAWYGGSGGYYGSAVVHLFDINSSKYKTGFTWVANDQDGSGHVNLNAGTWWRQPAITEIDIIDAANSNFAEDSMVSLFGILPRMAPPSATVTLA